LLFGHQLKGNLYEYVLRDFVCVFLEKLGVVKFPILLIDVYFRPQSREFREREDLAVQKILIENCKSKGGFSKPKIQIN